MCVYFLKASYCELERLELLDEESIKTLLVVCYLVAGNETPGTLQRTKTEIGMNINKTK